MSVDFPMLKALIIQFIQIMKIRKNGVYEWGIDGIDGNSHVLEAICIQGLSLAFALFLLAAIKLLVTSKTKRPSQYERKIEIENEFIKKMLNSLSLSRHCYRHTMWLSVIMGSGIRIGRIE